MGRNVCLGRVMDVGRERFEDGLGVEVKMGGDRVWLVAWGERNGWYGRDICGVVRLSCDQW